MRLKYYYTRTRRCVCVVYVVAPRRGLFGWLQCASLMGPACSEIKKRSPGFWAPRACGYTQERHPARRLCGFLWGGPAGISSTHAHAGASSRQPEPPPRASKNSRGFFCALLNKQEGAGVRLIALSPTGTQAAVPPPRFHLCSLGRWQQWAPAGSALAAHLI